MPLRALAVLLVSAMLALGATCSRHDREISRDEAIVTARRQARFEPVSWTADRATEQDRPVWRVTLKGPRLGPDQPLLFDSLLVTLDRRTGEILSLARP